MLVAFGTQWFEDKSGNLTRRWYPERFAVSRNKCDAMILRARIQGWMDRIRFRRQFVPRIVFLPKESCFEMKPND
jgi:hypothetical protein